ncbi:MAG: glycosyltransferase family 4 protein [Anaerolineae bacterium]
MHRLRFLAFANSIIDSGTLAGGYRIFMECVRHWLKEGQALEVVASKEGVEMMQRYLNMSDVKVHFVGPSGPPGNPGWKALWYSVSFYVLRTFTGSLASLGLGNFGPETVVYSTTPFWPDVFPALIVRLRNPHSLWLVALSMFAPPVLGGWGREIKASKAIEPRALVLKINEILAYPLIKRWADLIYVNNELDRERCIADGISPERLMVLGGGVDIALTDSVTYSGPKNYEAVFIGRFHPQKGVLELVDIWKKVCQVLPQARLAMIGNGPLEKAVAEKIQSLNLEENVRLMGFMDGAEKIRIFRQSRIVLHPSLYDSGGMAACEAMACGLPGVSFDLPALRVYYPKGMLKSKDEDSFVDNVLRLLKDSSLYEKVGREARELAVSWDWSIVSQSLLQECQAISLSKGEDRCNALR